VAKYVDFFVPASPVSKRLQQWLVGLNHSE
jgi:hypothetical protein